MRPTRPLQEKQPGSRLGVGAPAWHGFSESESSHWQKALGQLVTGVHEEQAASSLILLFPEYSWGRSKTSRLEPSGLGLGHLRLWSARLQSRSATSTSKGL